MADGGRTIETTRDICTRARIDPAWIEPLADHLVNRTYSDEHWDRRSASALAFERVSLWGLTIVPRRRVRYGPIDPARSRELFIRHGLVEGEYDTSAEFVRHNQRLLDEAHDLRAKLRRNELLRGDEARYDFYDARIPGDVYDGPRFEKWRKQVERENPRLLMMTQADLLHEADDFDAANIPIDFAGTNWNCRWSTGWNQETQPTASRSRFRGQPSTSWTLGGWAGWCPA